MRYKKAVIVVCREESTKDFEEIARRVRRLDPTIGIATVSEFLTSKMVPPELINLPLLVIYLCNPPVTEFNVATKLAVKEMGKIDECEYFKRHNLPCLPVERFKQGMELDSSIYGDWVILKPEFLTSTGASVNMVPTKLLPTIKIKDFPKDHLINKDSYLVQKFIKTGKCPTHYRALVFLGEILYSARSTQKSAYPIQENNIRELLKTSVASNLTGHRAATLSIENNLNEFALNVAKAFPDQPLLGIDIIKDEKSDTFYVLEVNLGGNTWAFSSRDAHLYRLAMGGRKPMVLQYKAWDRAAEALVRKTNYLAR